MPWTSECPKCGYSKKGQIKQTFMFCPIDGSKLKVEFKEGRGAGVRPKRLPGDSQKAREVNRSLIAPV